MMRNFILAVIVFFSLGIAIATSSNAEAAGCKRDACNKAADIISFSGDRKLSDQIRVEVCHGYWNLLNEGTYAGRRTKWWAAVMNYASWYGDLPVVTAECKTYWVKPGTELKLYAECVQRVISTGRMTRPGKYVMT